MSCFPANSARIKLEEGASDRGKEVGEREKMFVHSSHTRVCVRWLDRRAGENELNPFRARGFFYTEQRAAAGF